MTTTSSTAAPASLLDDEDDTPVYDLGAADFTYGNCLLLEYLTALMYLHMLRFLVTLSPWRSLSLSLQG